VVDFFHPSVSEMLNYLESLVMLDKENKVVPCLGEDWRYVGDRTIEFKLRDDVRFQNGEKFNAEAVMVNWQKYRRMESPGPNRFLILPDEMNLEIIDEYTVRFTFPTPDGLALIRILYFPQVAPAFFVKHKFAEQNWGYFPEAGPWGTGPFVLVEGAVPFGRPSKPVVLRANDDYWDRRYPKLKEVIFANDLIGDRDGAMRLCEETEKVVDLVSHIRPLDTLKVSESRFAKVVKSRDVTVLNLIPNQFKKNSKWKDIRLRKALNYAINRQELLKYAAKGNAYNQEGSYIPADVFGHNPNLPPCRYSATKARELLTEAGYPNGFAVKLMSFEAYKLEGQIISKMLERVGLEVILEVLSRADYVRRMYVPLLHKPPEEQDWDVCIAYNADLWGHPGASLLAYSLIEEGEWLGPFDPAYEAMWHEMAGTFDKAAQEEVMRKMVKHLYDQASIFTIYSPLTLYAVNKEVNFVPQKSIWLRLKETSVTDNHWSVLGRNN
jgi:peptide/nickel transport system substrate-binding protein